MTSPSNFASPPPPPVGAVTAADWRTGLLDLDALPTCWFGGATAAAPSSAGNFLPLPPAPKPDFGLLCTLPTRLCATEGATETTIEFRPDCALLLLAPPADPEVEVWLLLLRRRLQLPPLLLLPPAPPPCLCEWERFLDFEVRGESASAVACSSAGGIWTHLVFSLFLVPPPPPTSPSRPFSLPPPTLPATLPDPDPEPAVATAAVAFPTSGQLSTSSIIVDTGVTPGPTEGTDTEGGDGTGGTRRGEF